MLRGRFIAILLTSRNKRKKNNLTLYLKQLENEELKNPKVSRRKEIIKIRTEINEKETDETIVKINKTKSLFFEKINTIDKPLARLIKKKREKNQITKLEMKMENSNRQHRNTNDHKRLLSATICQ